MKSFITYNYTCIDNITNIIYHLPIDAAALHVITCPCWQAFLHYASCIRFTYTFDT